MNKLYPHLKVHIDDGIKRTEEVQSDSDSFLGSPTASSTPKNDGPILRNKTKKSTSSVIDNETILAGYTSPARYDHTTTNNSTMIQSLFTPEEYYGTLEDFKRSCCTGDWWNFLAKHHLRILFFVLVILVCWSLYLSLSNNSIYRPDLMKEYRKELRHLRQEYNTLTKADENTLLVVGQQWIIEERPEPVVLTVAGTDSSVFIERLFRAIKKHTSGKITRGAIFADDKVSREQLQSEAIVDLKSTSLPVTAICGIEILSWDAPLVLHALADSDSFPVANSLILLSINRKIDVSCEAGIEEYLKEMWISSGGNMDNVTPILSRILGYTVCL